MNPHICLILKYREIRPVLFSYNAAFLYRCLWLIRQRYIWFTKHLIVNYLQRNRNEKYKDQKQITIQTNAPIPY